MGDQRLKNILIKKLINIVKSYKECANKKMLKRKIEDEIYMRYVMNAIREAEEDIANGGKTYTLEEYQEIMRERYGADI